MVRNLSSDIAETSEAMFVGDVSGCIRSLPSLGKIVSTPIVRLTLPRVFPFSSLSRYGMDEKFASVENTSTEKLITMPYFIF